MQTFVSGKKIHFNIIWLCYKQTSKFVGVTLDTQVYNCLHCFMVCMSPTVTSSLIDKITDDYDAEVMELANELQRCIEVSAT